MAKKPSLVWSWRLACAVGSPNNNDGDGNITQKVKSLCFKLYRDYLISFNSQDVGNFFLELNSKRLYRSSGKEKETLWHFANSLINPIAYTCRLSIFRKTLNGLVQRRQVRVEIIKLWNKMSLCKLGHPSFFLFSVECVSWYWVGRSVWKNRKRKSQVVWEYRRPWYPRTTLKLNIHILRYTI